MTIRLPRAVLASLLLLGLGAAVVLVRGTPDAAAATGNKVVCAQVQQLPGRLDENFIATFMSEQIAEGRQRFQTVQGVSTVLCAW
ncbi:MAG: hypothetical protein H6735_17605 [Alphaproteobacteria bacterium]|nr:hypothetical protein [Alphaproteobacteria bacterium]